MQPLRHLLTHFPNKPYCKACHRARLRRQPTASHKFDKSPTEFGENVTADHIIANSEELKALLLSGLLSVSTTVAPR